MTRHLAELVRSRRGRGSPSPESRVACTRALADLIAVERSTYRALDLWSMFAPPEASPALERVRRRLHLGAPEAVCLQRLAREGHEEASAVARLFSLYAGAGGDLSAMLASLADEEGRRAGRRRDAAAAGSGARLSARLVAALPLLFLPLLPAARAPLFDGVGGACLVGGAALAVAGIAWIAKLVPPPPDAGAVTVITPLAALLRAGVPLGSAVDAVAAYGAAGWSDELDAARMRVRLGAGWDEALQHCCDEDLRMLGREIARAGALGHAPSRCLDALTEASQRRARAVFEERLRRAPVLMVVPLVLCLLPSFVLLALVPFLRSFL